MSTTEVKEVKHTNLKIPSNVLNKLKELNVGNFLPKSISKKLYVEFHKTNTELINSIVRTLESEIPVYALVVDIGNIKTDDAYIFPQLIAHRLSMMPIKQFNNIKLSLNVKNNSDVKIKVYSESLSDDAKIGSDIEILSPGYVICELNPGCKISIDNIVSKKGIKYLDGAKYSLPFHVRYRQLDYDSNISSMERTGTKYSIEIPYIRNIDPKDALNLAIDTLVNKLDGLRKKISKADSSHSDEYLQIKSDKSYTEYSISKETSTIGNIAVRYIYNIDPQIKNVTWRKDHLLKDYIIIRIEHNESKKILLQAFENAIEELKSIKDQINKKK